jgi:hypothetical protein
VVFSKNFLCRNAPNLNRWNLRSTRCQSAYFDGESAFVFQLLETSGKIYLYARFYDPGALDGG